MKNIFPGNYIVHMYIHYLFGFDHLHFGKFMLYTVILEDAFYEKCDAI